MALYELSTEDVAKIELAARFLRSNIATEDAAHLRRLEKLEPTKPDVAIYTEGGLVQGVRASHDVAVTVADLDNVEDGNCDVIRDANRNPIICGCGRSVPNDVRAEHVETIERYHNYRALPFGVH